MSGLMEGRITGVCIPGRIWHVSDTAVVGL